MASSVKYIKGGVSISCDVSLYPAPRPQTLFAVPTFSDACASLITPSLVAIQDSGAAGIHIVSVGPLPGAATASWTLYDVCYQGSVPATLPQPLAYPLTLDKSNNLNITISYPLANAVHILNLIRIEAGKTYTYPSAEITTPVDPTQATLAALLQSIDALDNNNILAPSQKPQVITDYTGLMAQITYLRAEATSAGVVTFPTQTTLPAYLNGLGSSPTPTSVMLAGVATPSYFWSDTANQTVIPDRTAWDNAWSSATTEEAGLQSAILAITNGLATAAGSSASAALTAANSAESAALVAEAGINAIGNQNILTMGEKPQVILDYTALIQEQSGIDAQAVAYNRIGEQALYDVNLAFLTAYLTAPYNATTLQGVGLGGSDWSNVLTNSSFNGPIFRSAFGAVYNYRQNLLNAIYATAQSIALTGLATAENYVPNWDSELGPMPGVAGAGVYLTPGSNGGYSGSSYVRALNLGGNGNTVTVTSKVPYNYYGTIYNSDGSQNLVGYGDVLYATAQVQRLTGSYVGGVDEALLQVYWLDANLNPVTITGPYAPWQANTACYAGNGQPNNACCGPNTSPGISNLYMCIQSGTTGSVSPNFLNPSIATSNHIVDGTVVWSYLEPVSQQSTAVYYNYQVPAQSAAGVWETVGAYSTGLEMIQFRAVDIFGEPGAVSGVMRISATPAYIVMQIASLGTSQFYFDNLYFGKAPVVQPATTTTTGAVSVPDSTTSALKVTAQGALSLDTTSPAFTAAVQSVAGGGSGGGGGGYAPLTISAGTTFTIPTNSQCVYLQPILDSGTILIQGTGLLFGHA